VDDNILLTRNAVDDTIYDIVPGLAYVFGANSNIRGSLSAQEAFARYVDHDEFDTNLFSAVFTSNYDDEKMKVGFGSSYRELNQNTVDVRNLVRRDVFNVYANLEMLVTAKSSVGAGAMYDNTRYKISGYADTEIMTVPLNYYLKLTPKTDLSFGYRFRDTSVSIGRDSNDHFFNVGARGEFTPKLTGRFAVGYNRRSISGDSHGGLGVDSTFAYAVTPKTNIQFGINNDFGTSGQGAEQKNFVVTAGVNTRVSAEWGFSAAVNRRDITYTRREDLYWEGQLGVDYTINEFFSLRGGYVYRQNDSSVAYTGALSPFDPNFTNNIFSLAANVRF